jgi:surface protein
MGFMFYRSNFANQSISGIPPQNLSSWNVTNVTTMREMFSGPTGGPYPQRSLNGLQNWDTSNVENMAGMFSYCFTNPSIANWTVSNVTNMNNMFKYNATINRNLQNWNVQNDTTFVNMFEQASAMKANYGNPPGTLPDTPNASDWSTYW